MSVFPRRFGALVVVTCLALVVVAGMAAAATPVTVGYRGPSMGGVSHATAEKPQSKLWYTDGAWFAGMFQTSGGRFRIYKLNPTTHDWSLTGPILDTRDGSHGDYLWHEASQTLWIASSYPTDTTAPFADDQLKVFRTTYNAATNTYGAATTAIIPNTQSTTTAGEGGTVSVTIARDTGGRLWTAWTHSGEVRYSISDDGGATWSVPAQLPSQVGNPLKVGSAMATDIVSVVSFGTRVGFLWSDHSEASPADTSSNGFYFSSIAAGDDPTDGTRWSSAEKLPSVSGANDGERADNHLNVKVASDGTIYAVGKTGKDTANCATNKQLPLINLFRRTTAGTWSATLVSTVGDCNTRAQLVLSEQLGVVYVFLTSPNGGGAIHVKSAPLSGPEALKFRTADQTLQPGTPFIKSATETQIDDPTTTKQTVTGQSGIVVLANNITAGARYYLHNELAIGGSADSTAPVGTITINAGALSTAATAVSLAVPATDAGSGVSQVRIADAATVNGSGVLSDASAKTFAYTTPVSWTLATGDGTKTVWAQWRDGAGNWSTPTSDTIELDTTGPTGTVSINGGAATTPLGAVSVAVAATDPSGVAEVRLSNSPTVTNGVLATGTTFAYATPVSWTLTPNNGTKTVYVQWKDTLGNWSGVASDTIELDSPDSTFTALTPVRLLDSRDNNPAGIVRFSHNVTQTFQIAGREGVPANATAITGNLTVTGATAPGVVTLGPNVTPPGATSTLNFPAGDTRANGVVVPLDANGKLTAFYRAGTGRTAHLILDVTGYFTEGTSAGRFTGVEPARFLDTRANTPVGATLLKGGVPYGFTVAGRTVGDVTIPTDATAVTGNLTVTGATRGGYLALTPTEQANPTTSTLNFPAGETRANNVTVPIGAGGKLWVVLCCGATPRAHAIFDVTGYYKIGGAGMVYVPLSPARIVDSRGPIGLDAALTSKVPGSFSVRGQGGVAMDAGAFTGNVTITGQRSAGYVSITVTPDPAPLTSTVNFAVGQTVANGIAAMIDEATGKASATFRGATGDHIHLIVDVTGYFH